MATKAKRARGTTTAYRNTKIVRGKLAPVRTPEQKLVGLCRELDAEMDGVRVPWTAAAILGGIRAVLNEMK